MKIILAIVMLGITIAFFEIPDMRRPAKRTSRTRQGRRTRRKEPLAFFDDEAFLIRKPSAVTGVRG